MPFVGFTDPSFFTVATYWSSEQGSTLADLCGEHDRGMMRAGSVRLMGAVQSLLRGVLGLIASLNGRKNSPRLT